MAAHGDQEEVITIDRFLEYTDYMLTFWRALHVTGGTLRAGFREIYDGCFAIAGPDFTFDTVSTSDMVATEFFEKLVDRFNEEIFVKIPLRWTGGVFRKADGSYKSSFWLLPRGREKIVVEAQHADRSTAFQMAFTHAMYEFFSFIDHSARAGLNERRPAPLSDERARLAREHADVQERKRAERAQQDAEWDAVGSGSEAAA